MHDTAKPKRIPLLDGLRGLAALLVLFYHIDSMHGEQGSIFGQGILAVDFFFLLSGFVISLAFEPRLMAGLSAASFMKIRVFRLWPALAVGILLGAVAHSVLTPSLLVFPLIVMSLLMIPAFVPGGGYFLLVAVQWSLLFELIANFLHALFLVRLSDRALAAACVLSGAVFLYASILYQTTGVGCDTATFAYGVPRVLFSYTMGMLFARRRGDKAAENGRWWIVLPALVGVICGVSMLPAAFKLAGQIAAIFVAFPLLFRRAIATRVPDRAAPLLLWLGAISYPVYTIHYPVLFLTADANALLFPETSMRLWDAIGVAAIVLMAHAMVQGEIWLKGRVRSLNSLRLAPA